MAPQHDAGRLVQAAPGRFLVLAPGGGAGRGAVGRGGGPQSVPLLGGQAGVPDPVPLSMHAGPGPVLAGQHRHDVHVILGMADGDPANPVVFLAVPGQAGAVHHVMSDLRPLIIAEQLVARRGAHRAVPDWPGVPPLAQRVVRLVQQPVQLAEVPGAVRAQRRLQLGRMTPARDDMRVAVLLMTTGTVQVVDQRLYPDPARRADLPNHRAIRPGRNAIRAAFCQSRMIRRVPRSAIGTERIIQTAGPYPIRRSQAAFRNIGKRPAARNAAVVTCGDVTGSRSGPVPL